MSSCDQIIKIFERYPNINKTTDLSFVVHDEQSNYVEKLMDTMTQQSNISCKLHQSSPELVELLKQMLEINPYFRPSAKQLLKHKIFDNVRQENDKKSAPFKVKINIDENENAINYKNIDFKPELKTKMLAALIKESTKIGSKA